LPGEREAPPLDCTNDVRVRHLLSRAGAGVDARSAIRPWQTDRLVMSRPQGRGEQLQKAAIASVM